MLEGHVLCFGTEMYIRCADNEGSEKILQFEVFLPLIYTYILNIDFSLETKS